MARVFANHSGYISSSSRLLHRGPGQVKAILASHAESSVQYLTLYDGLSASGRLLLRLHVCPGIAPHHLVFPEPLRFELGLFVVAADLSAHLTTVGEPS